MSELNKRQLVAVARAMDHMSFEPGAALVKEMDVGRRQIIIREGTAEGRRQGFVAGEVRPRGSSKGPVVA